jgi:pilus assembly protein CpaB
MWKVKRMNTARLVVLANAVGAGGIAAFLAGKPGDLRWQTWPVATAGNTFTRCSERPRLVPVSIARASMIRCGTASSTKAWK